MHVDKATLVLSHSQQPSTLCHQLSLDPYAGTVIRPAYNDKRMRCPPVTALKNDCNWLC